MLRAILLYLCLGSIAMAANEKRMKKLAELSGVPYERILKFQKRESANGKYLTGDKGKSAGDLHLYKKTAIAIAKKLKNKKLVDKLESLSTKQEGGKYSFSPYSKYLVENPVVQDKLLLWLLKDTKKQTENYVKKVHKRKPKDYEHYAFWNASPKTAKKAIDTNFESDDEDLKVLIKNIKGFRKQSGSYLNDKSQGKVVPQQVVEENLDNMFLIPKDKSLIPQWMKKHGYNAEHLKKSDGSWYNPGDTLLPKLPNPEMSPDQMPLDNGDDFMSEQYIAEVEKGYDDWKSSLEPEPMLFNEGGYVDSWRREEPEEEVDQEMLTKQTAELQDPNMDIMEEYSIDELMEVRSSLPTEDKRRVALNQLIVKKKKFDKEKEEYAEMYKPHEGSRWGGEQFRDPTGMGAEFETESMVEVDDEGEETVLESGRGASASWDDTPTGGATGSWEEEKETEVVATPTAQPVKTGPSPEEAAAQQSMQEIKERQDYLKSQRDQLDAAIKKYNDDELRLTTIDPSRFWKNKGTLDKIIAIIGQAAGAYHMGRWGEKKNLWKEDIDKAIERDIEAQKLDNENKIKMKNAAYKRIELMTDRYRNLVTDKRAQDQLDMMKKHYAGIRDKNKQELVKDKKKTFVMKELSRPMTVDRMNELDNMFPKQKIRQRSIVGRDGMIVLASDENEARKLRNELIPEAEKIMTSASRMIDLRRGMSTAERLNPWSEKRAEAKVLGESIKGALRLEIFGPGVMTDTERRIATKVVGDPNAIFTMDDTEVKKLQTLMDKVSFGMRQRLRRAGINLPPSQNERRVKQMLSIRKLRDTPQNKAKVTTDLIRAQYKAREEGDNRVYWVFNEPLPL